MAKEITFSSVEMPVSAPIELPQTGDELTDRLIELRKKVEPKRISLRTAYPELRYLLNYKGVGLFVKGDIQGWKGAAKQGKSHALLIIIAALLAGSCMGFSACIRGANVLYIDTEMNPLNTAKMVRKVHALAGLDTTMDDARFVALSLRDEAYKDRVTTMEQAIELYRPDIVFLDGMRDLIADFNSIEESQGIINTLMRLTKQYDTAICSVMHIGKTESAGMRGHSGAELLNKASEVWSIKKDGCHILVEQTDCRNAPADNWGFYLDENGMPQELAIDKPMTKADKANALLKENMYVILGCAPLRYSELGREYQQIAGVKEPTANRAIGQALRMGYVKKIEEKYYRT